jgi:hypothetical protein
VIEDETESDIIQATQMAEARDFRPLLFVIPYQAVRRRIEKVPIASRASLLSQEFLIPLLPGRLFDVIEFGSAR